MWTTPELHAALNDLPAALFVVSLLFDITGHVTGRESLRSAGFWALVAAAGGAGLAVISGLRAESVIEHGSVMHRSIERHQTLAIAFTVLVIGLVVWRLFSGGPIPAKRPKTYLTVTTLGLVGLLWAAKIGGNIVFEHGGGIETSVLESALAERQAGHAHALGEEEHEHPATDAAPMPATVENSLPTDTSGTLPADEPSNRPE